jgi:formylglycine-generating enzyme required for sulfatase activity
MFKKIFTLAALVFLTVGYVFSQTASKPYKPAPKLKSAGQTDMVLIPTGEFNMGSPDGVGDKTEHPRHKVYVDAFYIDKNDVTVAKYAGCVKSGKCSVPKTYRAKPAQRGKCVKSGKCSIIKTPTDYYTWGVAGRENHPVTCVSWEQANAYCKWAGKRLPTEAEWEKAARGGTDTKWSFGDDVAQLGGYAWYDKNSGGATHPVGSKRPNQYGLYDMAGNVWQWVGDWYTDYGKAPEQNPTGPSSGTFRVLRGGSWFRYGDLTRAGSRDGVPPEGWDINVGFRCAAAAQ